MQTMSFLQCFFSFFKISLFTFGGGYAMLPMVEKELVEGKQCITEEDMVESYALAQTIPGVIGSNTAAIIGNKIAGVKGTIASTLGFITPSIIIIVLLADLLIKYQDYVLVSHALKGIKATVLALLLNIFLKLVIKSKEHLQSIFGLILAIVAFISVLFLGISPIYIIILAAVAGIIYWSRKDKAR